jgi:hypothetical protein
VKNNLEKVALNYKKNLEIRLENDNEERKKPMLSATNINYKAGKKVSAISCGGIGLVDTLVKKMRLPEMINNNLHLFKRHKPYFESDHILNIAYNIICGGTCLEDIELLRNNIPYMDAVGAKRIPDPTTAGDFLRRFDEENILTFMDIQNEATTKVWKETLNNKERQAGIIDVDGKIQKTYGECKEGMDMSYKGIWGFSTLALTEATTGAHLYVVNRPGNKTSQDGAVPWIDKSIEVVKNTFNTVYLRGDSDFSITGEFDRWTEDGTKFIFGYDAHPNLVKKADLLGENEWIKFSKPKIIRGMKRKKKHRVKENCVIKRKYRNKIQKDVQIAEFSYRPGKCEKSYRVIVCKKKLDIKEGQQLLFEDVKYLFYITNIHDMPAEELVGFIHGRANHENKIEQLANGIHALKMPAAEFMANWAYMGICSLAWNIKSWLGLFMPDKIKGRKIIACEFKSFQHRIINIPCQIIKTGRKIMYNILNYNEWMRIFYDTFQIIKKFKFSSA